MGATGMAAKASNESGYVTVPQLRTYDATYDVRILNLIEDTPRGT